MLLEKLGDSIEQGTVGFLMRRSTGIAILRAKTTLVNLSHILHLYLARFTPGADPAENITLTGKFGTAKRCGYTSSVIPTAAGACRRGHSTRRPHDYRPHRHRCCHCDCLRHRRIYNNMVTKRNRIDNAWQNIDTQLQRRNDLIPNLVETVKATPSTSKRRSPP